MAVLVPTFKSWLPICLVVVGFSALSSFCLCDRFFWSLWGRLVYLWFLLFIFVFISALCLYNHLCLFVVILSLWMFCVPF